MKRPCASPLPRWPREFGMDWTLVDRARKARVLILVSKFGHCLNDILFRVATQHLPVEVVAIASNHRDFYQPRGQPQHPFHHYSAARRHARAKAFARAQADRAGSTSSRSTSSCSPGYMQILRPSCASASRAAPSTSTTASLPSFAGARPTTSAYERGASSRSAPRPTTSPATLTRA